MGQLVYDELDLRAERLVTVATLPQRRIPTRREERRSRVTTRTVAPTTRARLRNSGNAIQSAIGATRAISRVNSSQPPRLSAASR
jgi:hypothetical protein